MAGNEYAGILNFATTKFCTVKCASPSTDLHEATNLIDEDISRRRRGFLAYSAIRPPIEIDFTFICPIHLHYISINSNIGSQKCTAIEILAKSSSSTNFESLCTAYFQEFGLLACNARYYNKNNLPRNNAYCVRYFKSKLFRTFICATQIRIRLLRTENSVPCLGTVEIYGRISKHCSNEQKVIFDSIVQQNLSTKRKHDNDEIILCKKLKTELPDSFKIPEEFLDSLTYEVMSIPITLPSGNNIDQSTLEKYTNIEASYGRKPSDPFTGIKFSLDNKPTLNVALKNRIDLFLVTNSHKTETFQIKRTLGKSSATSKTFSFVNPISPNQNNVKFEPKTDKLHSEPSSLDEAIKNAMSSTSFITFTGNLQSNDEIKIECAVCKMGDNLYDINCQHYYCKYCLFKNCMNIMKCLICDKPFSKETIKRFHC